MKGLSICLLAIALAASLPAQGTVADLVISPADVRIDANPGGGYLLAVRAKPAIKSVILTESTADPNRKLDSYTLRAKEYNPVNGDEKRRLNGKFIESKGMYFLMSSTPMPDPDFGQAFRILIPDVVVFGYPNARYGEITMLDGAYLNIRSFAQPYADYAGAYRDSPYTIRLTQKARAAAASAGAAYNQAAVKVYEGLAQAHGGRLSYSTGEADLIAKLRDVLAAQPAGPVDLALCLDASKSMENDAPFVRERLLPTVRDFLAGHSGSRVALVQFRDYMEDFLYRITPLSDDLSGLQAQLKEYYPGGGRDTPEAVYEGLYACVNDLDWRADRRLVILAGDAPPHPVPRGSVGGEAVTRGLAERGISLQAILLSD
jgi:hypothetical protein